MTVRAATLIVAVLMAVAAPAWADKTDWISPGPTVPDVTLNDQDGRSVSLAKLVEARPVIIGFFFTGCSATCPMQTAQLALLQEELAHLSPEDPRPLILSISLDPMGDTPESVTSYAENFDIQLGDQDGWLMLTGSYEALRPVWQAFGQDNASPQDHAPMFWIGQPAESRWTRVYVLADPAELSRMLLDGQS